MEVVLWNKLGMSHGGDVEVHELTHNGVERTDILSGGHDSLHLKHGASMMTVVVAT